MVFDPTSSTPGTPSQTIYVGSTLAGESHLFRSQDAGKTWQAMPGQPPQFMALKADIDSRGILYVAYGNGAGPNSVTDGAVWRFDPKSGAATDISPFKPGANGNARCGFCGISVDRQHPGTLVVTTLDRWSPIDDVLRTTDDGKTWKSMNSTGVLDISLSPFLSFGAKPKFV